ncbi:unnamed protein product [Cyclocybe aegerita]|uniref:F-box domain-containing protein n=1 Tax=Cyclocybe aegerita TaxID=1973307 RepID=A0A8S0VXP7_CYCAE|nr:unnamed protein product [Cyclocybe aegerita]
MSPSLSSLPGELIIEIMDNLDSPSILRMALCKHIRYVYELGLSYMRDNGSGKSIDELLTAFRYQRRAWAALEWKRFETVKPPPTLARFQQSSGILTRKDRNHLFVIYLPSSTRPIRTVQHIFHSMTDIRDYAIDANQDLVILRDSGDSPPNTRCFRLHCRMISTGLVHPKAVVGGILNFTIHGEHPINHQGLVISKVRLADDVVSLSGYWRKGFHLWLWNWTTGLLLFTSFENGLPDCPLNPDFELLRRDAFILTSKTSSGEIVVYKFSPTVPGIPVHVASFALPPTAPQITVISIHIHSGEFQPRSTPGSLFMHLPDSWILMFRISYTDQPYSVFVRASTLLKYLDDFAPGDEAQGVPWEKWGEKESRFMPGVGSSGNWPRLHGSRVVYRTPDRTGVGVLEFSNATLGLSSDSPICKRYGPDNPTVLPCKAIFLQDVVTRLPYHTVSKAMEGDPPHTYVIDEEHLIAFGVGPFLNPRPSVADSLGSDSNKWI